MKSRWIKSSQPRIAWKTKSRGKPAKRGPFYWPCASGDFFFPSSVIPRAPAAPRAHFPVYPTGSSNGGGRRIATALGPRSSSLAFASPTPPDQVETKLQTLPFDAASQPASKPSTGPISNHPTLPVLLREIARRSPSHSRAR